MEIYIYILSGSVYIHCIEVYIYTVWKCIYTLFGSVHTHCKDKCTCHTDIGTIYGTGGVLTTMITMWLVYCNVKCYNAFYSVNYIAVTIFLTKRPMDRLIPEPAYIVVWL